MKFDVTQPLLLPAGGGEVIGDSEERRVEILSDHDALHVTWSRFGPHREGAEPHVHRRHTDVFYVLEGELTVELGPDPETVVAPAETLVLAPPLVVHAFRNGSAADVRYLNFHAPGEGFAEYLRARRDGREASFDSEDPPADGGRRLDDAVAGIGEVVADRPGLRVALLAEIDELGVSEVWSEPGGPSPPQHLHRRHIECFYVLAGELAFTVAERELRADAGSFVLVPPGVPHTFAFPGSENVRFLNLHAPSCGFGDFVRALHAAGDEEGLQAARTAFDQVAV